MRPRWLLVVALLSLVGASCGGTSGETTEAPGTTASAETTAAPVTTGGGETTTTAGEKATIEVWYQDPAIWQGVIDTVVADFNQQSTTVEVIATPRGAGTAARDAVQVALAGGAGPDVITPFGPSLIPELVEAGHLLPLDPYVEQFGWDEFIAPWALELGRVDGVLYALPVELESLVLWYNKALFEEQGWQPPTTTAEFVSLAEEIQAAGVIPLAGGIGECPACIEWFFGEFVSHIAGPEKVNEALSGDIPFTDAAFVDSVTTFKDMAQAGYWMGGVDRFFTATFDEFSSAFASGEAAMNLEGTWFAGRAPEYFVEGRESDWDWVPVPSTSGEAIYSLGIGSIRAINANSENPEAAAEWLTYELSPEVQAKLLVDHGIALAPVDVEESMLTGLDPRMSRLWADFADAQAAGGIGYTVWTFWSPDSEGYIIDELQKVLTDDLTVEDFLAGLDEVFTADLQAGKTPPLP